MNSQFNYLDIIYQIKRAFIGTHQKICCKQYFIWHQKLQRQNNVQFMAFDKQYWGQEQTFILLTIICAFVNTQGGLIFLGIQNEYVNTVQLNENDRQVIPKFFNKLAKFFYPNLKIQNQQLKIYFVPVIQKKFRKFMKGHYVIKIRVKPGIRKIFYSFRIKIQDRDYFYVKYQNNNKIYQVTDINKIYDEIINRYQKPIQYKPIITHECNQPLNGEPLYVKIRQKKYEQKLLNQLIGWDQKRYTKKKKYEDQIYDSDQQQEEYFEKQKKKQKYIFQQIIENKKDSQFNPLTNKQKTLQFEYQKQVSINNFDFQKQSMQIQNQKNNAENPIIIQSQQIEQIQIKEQYNPSFSNMLKKKQQLNIPFEKLFLKQKKQKFLIKNNQTDVTSLEQNEKNQLRLQQLNYNRNQQIITQKHNEGDKVTLRQLEQIIKNKAKQKQLVLFNKKKSQLIKNLVKNKNDQLNQQIINLEKKKVLDNIIKNKKLKPQQKQNKLNQKIVDYLKKISNSNNINRENKGLQIIDEKKIYQTKKQKTIKLMIKSKNLQNLTKLENYFEQNYKQQIKISFILTNQYTIIVQYLGSNKKNFLNQIKQKGGIFQQNIQICSYNNE